MQKQVNLAAKGVDTGLLNVNEAKISELIRMWGAVRVNLAKLSEKTYDHEG